MDAATLIAAILLTISPINVAEMKQQLQAEARATPPAPQKAAAKQPAPVVAVAPPMPTRPSPSISQDVWYRLATCESENGRTSANQFQFTLSSWHGVGMTGRPENHSYLEQRAAAQRLVARYGFASQFPACSKKLGLT